MLKELKSNFFEEYSSTSDALEHLVFGGHLWQESTKKQDEMPVRRNQRGTSEMAEHGYEKLAVRSTQLSGPITNTNDSN